MQASAERFGAKTEYAEVTSLELNGDIKKITTTSGDFLAYTVVIATGADPRELGIKGEKELIGRGLHYCAHCDGRFYKGKTVMVVGGGNSAAADALYLSNLVEKVYVVHRRDTLRATKIYHAPLMKAQNVEFIWNSVVDSYILDTKIVGAKVRNVLTDESQDVMLDGIFVSIGREPNTSIFAGQIELDKSGYVVADETTKTNISGVFAVGDVRTKHLRQVVTAVADGAVAVHFAEEYLANKK